MAKIFNAPKELPEPEVDYKNYDRVKEADAEQAWLKKLKAYCIKHGNGETAGEEVSTGVADGYARYMVFSEKPLQLIHLHLGDAYSGGAIWERGLRLADVRQMVKWRKEPLLGSSAH
jgi:hypothetical protein